VGVDRASGKLPPVIMGLEQSVQQQIERLDSASLRQIEAQTVRKRLSWLEARGERLRSEPATPRRVFESLFADYMGLDLGSLPVETESETQITWLSTNPCPTLEACLRTGRDTREVCRGAFERSTQAFVSWFDPRLRFLRDYEQIRPYSPHCRERIVRVDLEAAMRLAIEEAHASLRSGDKGYGAVVLLGEDVVSHRHDTATTEGDPSLHAEVNAIRDACRRLGRGDLGGALLITTCEPCPMCSSLAVWAGVSAIVFGASIEATARAGKARILLPAREVVERSPARIEVIPGVLQEDCLSLYLTRRHQPAKGNGMLPVKDEYQ
jgi:tRNA(adenine34) deaminase